MSVSLKSFSNPLSPEHEKIGFFGCFEPFPRPAACALVSSNPHRRSSPARGSKSSFLFFFNFRPHQLWKSALQQRYTPKKTRDTSQGHKVKLLLTTKYFARRCHDHSRSSNMSCQIFNFPSSVQNNGKLVTVTFPFFHRAPCTFSKISKTGTPKPSP